MGGLAAIRRAGFKPIVGPDGNIDLLYIIPVVITGTILRL